MSATTRRLPLVPRRRLQAARRLVQLSVLAFIVAIPILGRYGNYLASKELDARLARWAGSPQGAGLRAADLLLRTLPGGETARAGRLVRDEDRVLERLRALGGNAWSAQVGSISLTDPLAAAESFAASRRTVNAMIVSLLVPLAVTLLLGRVFCSWLCPMGLLLELTGKLRGLSRFLELPPFDLRFPRATKFLMLALGLALAALWSVPVLGSLYPPAVLSREASGLVSMLYERAETGACGWTWDGLSAASLFLLGIVLFELLISERWWCRYVCPGGALYALLGRFRPVRVRRDPGRCTACGECVRVCGMGLAPMMDRMGMECDNCGLCISHCDDGALAYALSVGKRRERPSDATPAPACVPTARIPLLALVALLVPAPAAAHHILGIPHYAYDESYPQAPVITYRTDAGAYDVKMTGYPGTPVPGERVSLHVYITERGGGAPFLGPVSLTVIRDGILGLGDIVYGPVEAEASGGLYRFFPTFDREDNYLVRIDFSIDEVPWTIDLPVVVGEPGSPLTALALFGGGLAALFVVVRAARIKARRRSGTVRPEGRMAPA
jgi:ferredoxin-type protein NapH